MGKALHAPIGNDFFIKNRFVKSLVKSDPFFAK